MTDVMEHADAGADTGVDDNAQIAADSPEIEALALQVGWKRAEDWKGEGHSSASEYLKHQAERAREKSDELRSVNKKMDKLARTSASIMERQLREQREELEGRYADMVAANKPGEARRISQEIDKLDQADSPDDVASEFKERNSAWFGKDEDATALAYGVCAKEADKGANYEVQLEKAEATVKKRFPELFSDTSALRSKAPVVGSPSSRAAPSRAREYTAQTLPPEAKKSLDGYLGKIDPKDTAKRESFTKRYVETYNKENGQ